MARHCPAPRAFNRASFLQNTNPNSLVHQIFLTCVLAMNKSRVFDKLSSLMLCWLRHDPISSWSGFFVRNSAAFGDVVYYSHYFTRSSLRVALSRADDMAPLCVSHSVPVPLWTDYSLSTISASTRDLRNGIEKTVATPNLTRHKCVGNSQRIGSTGSTVTPFFLLFICGVASRASLTGGLGASLHLEPLNALSSIIQPAKDLQLTFSCLLACLSC